MGIKQLHILKHGAMYFVVALLLGLVAACGTPASTGSQPTGNSSSTPAATATSGSDTSGYGNGGYGSGAGKATPTPTTAVTGANQTVTIMLDSSGSFTFSPKSLTIPVNTTIVWQNKTDAPHTIASDTGAFSSGGTASPLAAQSGSFHYTFTKTGTYAYHCEFHPAMVATIIVK